MFQTSLRISQVRCHLRSSKVHNEIHKQFVNYAFDWPTSHPGPLRGSEALVREVKALVNTGHVCPKILDIFVTWPY